MRHPRKAIQRDILYLASENAGTHDPATLFGILFDAAIRSIRQLPTDHPGRWMVLQQAWDTIHHELGGRESGLPGVTATTQDNGGAGVMPRHPRRRYTP